MPAMIICQDHISQYDQGKCNVPYLCGLTEYLKIFLVIYIINIMKCIVMSSVFMIDYVHWQWQSILHICIRFYLKSRCNVNVMIIYKTKYTNILFS